MIKRTAFLAAAATLYASAGAHPHPSASGAGEHNHSGGWVHENGIGPDPDNDTNPATDTTILPFVGEVLTGADGTVFPVIHFEPPPGTHGEAIRTDYEGKYGVTFGPGLSWQVCEGQRHFYYNSMCTYEAPTSGKFAAGYLNYLNSPLVIEFEEPVCLVSMSMYPTGAKQREPFVFKIQGWGTDGLPIDSAQEEFEWRKETVRFRNIAGAYFDGKPAKKIAVSMQSLDPLEASETLRYLIDDLAFVSGSCEDAIDEIEKRSDVKLRERIYRLNRREE